TFPFLVERLNVLILDLVNDLDEKANQLVILVLLAERCTVGDGQADERERGNAEQPGQVPARHEWDTLLHCDSNASAELYRSLQSGARRERRVQLRHRKSGQSAQFAFDTIIRKTYPRYSPGAFYHHEEEVYACIASCWRQ